MLIILYFAACPDSPAILTGTQGTFGINATQFVNNMHCSWKINVDAGMVSDITPPVYFFPSFLSFFLYFFISASSPSSPSFSLLPLVFPVLIFLLTTPVRENDIRYFCISGKLNHWIKKAIYHM